MTGNDGRAGQDPAVFAETLGDILYPNRLPEAEGGLDGTLLTRIAGSYDFTLDRAGASPAAVLWSSRRAQTLRFSRLLRGLGRDRLGPFGGGDPVSLADMGCGYGALFGWLRWRPCLWRGTYTGYDISPRMIATAQQRYDRDCRARFVLSAEPQDEADYYLASGLFGLRLDVDGDRWERWCRSMLAAMAARSRRGMAFNMLDARGRDCRPTLYYADPAPYVAFCREELGGEVILIEDRHRIDFTVLVRWRR